MLTAVASLLSFFSVVKVTVSYIRSYTTLWVVFVVSIIINVKLVFNQFTFSSDQLRKQ